MLKDFTGKHISLAIFSLGIMAAIASAERVSVPFSDTFESYPNQTPLIDGINGWYATTNSVIVQTNTFYSGAKAALIPSDAQALSNRVFYVTNEVIWASMYVQASPGMFDVPNTNATALFGVGTNGHFCVCDGTNWTELATAVDGSPAQVIPADQWTRLDLRMDYPKRRWALFANYQLVTTNTSFVNTNKYIFTGLNIEGMPQSDYPHDTNYLDNFEITFSNPPNISTNYTWIPGMAVDVTTVNRSILVGDTAASNLVYVTKSSGYIPLYFTNSIIYTNCGTNTGWLSVTPSCTNSYGESQKVQLDFNTASLPASNQPYQAVVRIDGSDIHMGLTASNSPQTVLVSVYVQSRPELGISPTTLTNSVTFRHRANAQELFVANTSALPHAPMAYTVSVNQPTWISASPTSGSVADNTNSIALIYTTENLAPNLYTAIVTVAVSGVATKQASVRMLVNTTPGLTWNAGAQNWTNTITEGQSLAGPVFEVWNCSGWPTGAMNFTVSSDAAWLSLTPSSGTSTGDHKSVTASYIVSSLTPGVYTSAVTVSAVDASTGETATNSPLTIAAKLTVKSRAAISVDVSSLSISVLENYGATNVAAFNVWNSGAAPRNILTYSVIPSATWLTVSPSEGTLTDNTNAITVTWQSGALAPGTYSGSITVYGTDQAIGSQAVGSPITIPATLTVVSRTPVNLEKPSIYGLTAIGQTLHARNGLWQNMDRLVFTYQWQHANNPAGAGVTDIGGETTTNHVVAASDKGKYMRIAVTAIDSIPEPRTKVAYSEFVSSAKIKALPSDFNGDAIADLWFFDPLTGIWRASFSGNNFAEGAFGKPGMTSVPGDYNGDGNLDVGVYDNSSGMWHVLCLPSGPSLSGSMFGGRVEETMATPVPYDYDGDGQTDPALYLNGFWAILYSTQGRISILQPIAGANAFPAPADYDGDSIIDLGVYDSGLWTIHTSIGWEWSVSFGGSTWLPAPGDYDGDNIADLGIYSPSLNTWNMIYTSSGATASTNFGSSLGGNIPCQGYYDHDAYCDPATIHYSTDGDFLIWCVTRTADTNFSYRGQSYQKSINDWRVSW